MLSEAWMDGSDFGRFPEGWNGKYAVILNDMGVKKKK